MLLDENGLESLINVTAGEQDLLVTILKGEPIVQHNVLLNWILRASSNRHRQYKIYEFNSLLIEEDLVDMFEICPRIIIDEIRKTGRCLYE